MEENVALDSNKQKQFVKSIKGIKKLIKKNVAKSAVEAPQDVKVKEKPAIDGKIRKRKPKRKGLVYLGHIPHGFYEHEMTQYFKQFGVVTNARVIRSKRTGNSKGYAFVEFKEPTVAEIVAETMNNYLMGKRLIKSAYIPPEKQRRYVFRKHWSANNNPGNSLRIKMKKAHNADKDEQGELQRVKKLLSNLSKNKKKLRELGIEYDFFTPVDMPAALIKVKDENKNKKDNEEIKKEENAAKTKKGAKKDKVAEDKKVAVKDVKSKKNAMTSVQLTQSQPGKKEKQEHAKQIQSGKKEQAKQTQPGKKEKVEQLKQKQQSKQEIVDQSKQKKQAKKDVDLPKQKQQAKKDVVDQCKQNQPAKKENIAKPKQSELLKKEKVDKLIKDIQEIKTNKNLQKKKQQDLKDKGVKPLEDFLKVQESDNESNSSYAFDSDEYEKMIENENESGSDVSDDNSQVDYSSDGDEEVADSDASSEESEIEPPLKKKQKAKPVPILAQPMPTKKNANKQEVQKKIPQQGKRKAPQPQKAVIGAAPKKQKFEKQNNQKARNKQFKKK